MSLHLRHFQYRNLKSWPDFEWEILKLIWNSYSFLSSCFTHKGTLIYNQTLSLFKPMILVGLMWTGIIRKAYLNIGGITLECIIWSLVEPHNFRTTSVTFDLRLNHIKSLNLRPFKCLSNSPKILISLKGNKFNSIFGITFIKWEHNTLSKELCNSSLFSLTSCFYDRNISIQIWIRRVFKDFSQNIKMMV